MGVATAVLSFATLLLHELGHARQAQREGIPTRRITLFMLGGVAQGGGEFETPGTETRVALEGPAVSAAEPADEREPRTTSTGHVAVVQDVAVGGVMDDRPMR
jgi:Zn-dependent protease